jgi:hypothetical protein
MGFFGRLFGRRSKAAEATAAADTGIDPQAEAELDAAEREAEAEPRLNLQVLYPKPPTLDSELFLRAIHKLHPSMADATLTTSTVNGAGEGTISWGPHRIEILIRRKSLPIELTRRIIAAAPDRREAPTYKDQIKAHKSYVVLYHEDNSVAPWDQYVALAAAAAALSRQQGATTITNAFAAAAMPSIAFDQLFKSTDATAKLHTIPPAMLYCGFIKLPLPQTQNMWMRTIGAHHLDLPDLALLAENAQQGNRVFGLFNTVLDQVRKSNIRLEEGQIVQLSADMTLRVRLPKPPEYMLENPGKLYVIEPQSAGVGLS